VPLVDSLLAAIVRADGDALVMHVGEKPYVVTGGGSVELSTKTLTAESMTGMLAQLLPEEARQALEEVGAVEHDVRPLNAMDDERFALVAARGGDDIWIEIRRHRTPPAADTDDEAGAERAGAPPPSVWHQAPPPPSTQSAVVLPLRASRIDTTPAPPPTRPAGLDRLIRLAAARGASTLYIVADSRPWMRVDGEITPLDGEGQIGASEVETLMLDLAPEPSRDALRSGIVTEWISDVLDVGPVRCTGFREHRGPGGIFRLIPTRPLTVENLGLSQEIQGLCSQPDGLVVVTGRRSSGKSTLITAFVDLINRNRSDHVIILENQIQLVHEGRRSFVSQREVRGDTGQLAAAARAALREDPDVLVIEDLRSPEVIGVALEAAEAGRLVIGAMAAPSTTAAIERMFEQFPLEERPRIQQSLARALRGVVAQVLLRKTGGGRLAARELLLNTPPVANLIAEGKTFQLPFALESGRKHGMVPLNDALAAFVQGGATDAREAHRKAFDRDGLLNQLKHAGVDTSFVERLA
jgi:twitching motility protein PilT